MGLRETIKVNRKTFFNPRKWIDYDGIKDQQVVIWSILKGVMTAPEEGRKQSFEKLVEEKGLKESEIADGISTYRALAVVFVLLGLASTLYAFYLLFFNATLAGFLLSAVVATLFFSQAFKYDFWALEMRERKLGLTFADWKRQYLG